MSRQRRGKRDNENIRTTVLLKNATGTDGAWKLKGNHMPNRGALELVLRYFVLLAYRGGIMIDKSMLKKTESFCKKRGYWGS